MQTGCPYCGRAIDAPEGTERGTCVHCGQPVRFLDVPERPCQACGGPVPLLPGEAAHACPSCGRWNAADAHRDVEVRLRCPRCRRLLRLPADKGRDGEGSRCPHCQSSLTIRLPREQP